MPTARSLVAFSLTVLIASSSVRADQQHIVAPAQVAAAVAYRVAQQDADRAAVSEALKRPEVREFATRMGVDLSTVDARISTLAGADLQQAADAARQINGDLVGGSSVTINTTTLIIILLLFILLIVALK
jgi:predicted outer membrane protein